MPTTRRTYTSINPPRIFFIVSAPRSGSTMMASVLNSCHNCTCDVEPFTELAYQRRLPELHKLIQRKRLLASTPLYGQKDPAYYASIRDLYSYFRCSFIYVVRPKVAVAKSIMRWQEFFPKTEYAITADTPEHAELIWEDYNYKIMDALIEIPDDKVGIVNLGLDDPFPKVLAVLDWLGAKYKVDKVKELFERGINSPEERGFV